MQTRYLHIPWRKLRGQNLGIVRAIMRGYVVCGIRKSLLEPTLHTL